MYPSGNFKGENGSKVIIQHVFSKRKEEEKLKRNYGNTEIFTQHKFLTHIINTFFHKVSKKMYNWSKSLTV